MSVARVTLVVALATILMTATTAFADLNAGARIDLGFGYDTNPLLVSGEPESSPFAELRIDAGLTGGIGRGWDLFATLDGVTRKHSGSTANADASYALAEAGVGWSPAPQTHRGFTILAGGFAAVRRATLTDPVTGDVYAVRNILPSSRVPIGRRLDADQVGVFANLRWRIHRRLRVSLEGRSGSTNYVEDYESLRNMESLDYEGWTLQPRITVRAARGVWLDASYLRSMRKYDSYLARDEQGAPVLSQKRRFEYSGVEMRFRFAPGVKWTFDAGLVGTDRRDAFAGYLDTRGRTAFVAASRRLGLFHRLDLYASRTELDYDRATVTNDPASDIRAQDEVRISARLERRLRGRAKWFATVTREDSRNRDPRYVFDRTWLQTGIRLEL